VFFNAFLFGKEKKRFGIPMKKCGMWDSREKGAGMRDQEPPYRPWSPYEISRGNFSLLRKTKRHDGSNISRKSSIDQHQKKGPRYQKLKRT